MMVMAGPIAQCWGDWSAVMLGKLRQMFHRSCGRFVEFDLTPYRRILARIEKREGELGKLPDSRLKELSHDLISRARAGARPDELLVEAYALVREVSGRVLGMRHFDVQMLGGIALHHRRLIEMQTGEGKVVIVDEFTGRVVQDRHWPHGLQAAVEAKEGLSIQAEGLIRRPPGPI